MRQALKRKPDSEVLILAAAEDPAKRVQYESEQLATIIELVPSGLHDDDGVKDPTQIGDGNGGYENQFIELANVAFDHHNFINVDQIFHHHSQPALHEYGQLWTGTDLIVLESCAIPPSPSLMPPPPVPPRPQFQQQSFFPQTNQLKSHISPQPAAANSSKLHERKYNKKSNFSEPKMASADSDSDVEDKSLSWLLNFKLDELPHLSPETKRKPLTEGLTVEKTFEADDTNVAENVVIENTTKA